jgi:outer membrane protein assembly factor BamA
LLQDHRNDAVNPTGGSFHSLVFQIAGRPLGSELNFTSLYNNSVFYFPWHGGTLATAFRFGWNHPFGSTAQFAPGQAQQLPPTERYFAGGSITLRGFGLDDAAPPATPDLEGGNAMTMVTSNTVFHCEI